MGNCGGEDVGTGGFLYIIFGHSVLGTDLKFF